MDFIYGLIIGIIIMYFLIEIRNNNMMGNSNILDISIKKLIRQAARWSTAAKQDNNSLIAVLHANYGAGYLWALKDIASSEQIKIATNIDISKFEKEITDVQDNATKKMAMLCPKYAPKSSYLSSLGKES